VIPFNYTRSAEDGHREKLRYLPSGDTAVAVTVENSNANPIPVFLANPGASGGEVKSLFGTAPVVASGVETLVTSYTVPVAKTSYLIKAQFSGTNIATYNLYINSVLSAVYRTYFSGALGYEIVFASVSVEGILLSAGDIVELKVIHVRPSVGDFDGRIQILENT
jgi:hypothetical protein